MNLRILKKLSKRAAPLLPLLGDTREQFFAAKNDSYHGLAGFPRSQWERSRCHPTFEGGAGEIVFTTRAGHRVVMREPSHPLKGTVMVGAVSGYYEPEWDEEAAYAALAGIVCWHFMEIDGAGEAKPTRPLRTPRDVFAAAADIIAENAR